MFNTKSPVVYLIWFPHTQIYPNIVQDLTNTFLHIISGGEPVKLVEVTICVNLFLSHHIPTHLYSRPAWRIMTNKSSLHPVQEAAGDRYSELALQFCMMQSVCRDASLNWPRCRLEKLNDLIVKSKPLRSWTSRSVGDVEVEITTRRTLSFLSGLVRFSLKV